MKKNSSLLQKKNHLRNIFNQHRSFLSNYKNSNLNSLHTTISNDLSLNSSFKITDQSKSIKNNSSNLNSNNKTFQTDTLAYYQMIQKFKNISSNSLGNNFRSLSTISSSKRSNKIKIKVTFEIETFINWRFRILD